MIKLCFAALAATLALFHWTSADLWVQSFFFNATTGHWVWSKQEPISHFLLYDGPRLLLGLIGVAALVLFAAQKWVSWARHYRRGLLIVALSVALVPTTTALLKEATNVACPRKLEEFGGKLPHVDVFEIYPEGTRPESRQRCFPASHASAGYSLLSLVFLFRRKRSKVLAGITALAAGSAMAIYKMSIGDHFLSHTIVSLEIAILIIALISIGTNRILPDRYEPSQTNG